jgi:hypothetical protein
MDKRAFNGLGIMPLNYLLMQSLSRQWINQCKKNEIKFTKDTFPIYFLL